MAHFGDVDLDDLAQVVGQPFARKVFVRVDELGPPSRDDASEQLLEGEVSTQAGLGFASEQGLKGDLAG